MRRYRATLTLAGAFALAGCTSQRQEYTAAVTHAQDRWEVACGRRPEPASVVLLDVETFQCGATAVASGCTDGQQHVTLATRSSADRDGLVLHELGHVLGARHLATGVSGVMVASLTNLSWRRCLTSGDLDAAGCPAPRPECR